MKKVYILLAIFITMSVVGDAYAQRAKNSRGRKDHKMNRVAKKKRKV